MMDRLAGPGRFGSVRFGSRLFCVFDLAVQRPAPGCAAVHIAATSPLLLVCLHSCDVGCGLVWVGL